MRVLVNFNGRTYDARVRGNHASFWITPMEWMSIEFSEEELSLAIGNDDVILQSNW